MYELSDGPPSRVTTPSGFRCARGKLTFSSCKYHASAFLNFERNFIVVSTVAWLLNYLINRAQSFGGSERNCSFLLRFERWSSRNG